MYCFVSGCKSTAKGRRIFHFPKDKDVWQKWKDFCNRKIEIDPDKPAYICSEHFLPTDYERNLKFEMGFAKRNNAKLLPTAVPTVRPKEIELKMSTYVEPMFIGNPKMEQEMPNDTFEHIDVMNEAEDFPPYELDEYVKYKTNVMSSLKKEIRKLRKENFALKKAARRHVLEYNKLDRSHKRCEYEKNNMEMQLRLMFTEGQIRKMKIGSKRRITWHEDDVERATELYLTSTKAYGILLKNNFPFPSIRTVQNWLCKGKIETLDETECYEMDPEMIDEIIEEEVIEEEVIEEEVIEEEVNDEVCDEMNTEVNIEIV